MYKNFFFGSHRSNSSIEHIVATLIVSHRAMRLDSVEYNLVLTLILCRPGKWCYLFNKSIISLLQFIFVYVRFCIFLWDLCGAPEFRSDLTIIGTNAKNALMKHVAFKSPTRYYEILACILSVTEDLAGYIKIIFFEPSVRNVPMNHLVSVIT